VDQQNILRLPAGRVSTLIPTPLEDTGGKKEWLIEKKGRWR
jgi:hypothetical protein